MGTMLMRGGTGGVCRVLPIPSLAGSPRRQGLLCSLLHPSHGVQGLVLRVGAQW